MKDDKFEVRGGFITQPLATRSKDDRPNLVYPVYHNGVEIYPDKQWIWENLACIKLLKMMKLYLAKTVENGAFDSSST